MIVGAEFEVSGTCTVMGEDGVVVYRVSHTQVGTLAVVGVTHIPT